MNTLMEWISKRLAPGLLKFTQTRIISSILAGFMKIMPFLLIGAVFQIVANLATLIAPKSPVPWAVMTNLTFGILSIVLAYTIAAALAEKHKVNPMPVGFVSIAVFLILIKPDFSNGGFKLADISPLGASGLFVAIVSALFVGEVMGQFIKRGWAIEGRGLPDFVADWFSPLIPGLLVVLVAWLVADIANIDLYSILAVLIAPVLKASDSYLGFLLIGLLLTVTFTIGINPAIFFGILFPLWMAAVGENAALVAQGQLPVHINTIQTYIGWVVLGGTGATLTLNFLLFSSKSKTLRSLGQAAILPAIMNINEPMIFGLPIAFNPLMAIPFIINGGLVNPTLVWLAMHFDLVAKPFNPAVIPWLPIGVTGFIFNQDWRGVILVVIELAINIVIWYPFYKAYEAIMTKREAVEVVAESPVLKTQKAEA